MRHFFGTLFIAALISGCATNNTKIESNKNTETGIVKKSEITKETLALNKNVISELHRILDGAVIEGKGAFKDNSKAVARNGALIIAINDMENQIGTILVEQDTVTANSQIKSIVSTRKSNLISGYTTVVDTYNKTTRVAEIVIRQNGKRIATEIAKITTEE